MAGFAVNFNTLDQSHVDEVHADDHIIGIYGAETDIDFYWNYCFKEIVGLDFFFSDNPIEAMKARDVL